MNRGSISGKNMKFSSSNSRPALAPTNFPVKWVTRAVPLVGKKTWFQVAHSLPSHAQIKNAWSYASCAPYSFQAYQETTFHLMTLVITVIWPVMATRNDSLRTSGNQRRCFNPVAADKLIVPI